MSPALSLLLYSAAVVVATWLGGLIPLTGRWRDHHVGFLSAFACGVLLGAAFLHMLPEAAEHSAKMVGIAALAGLLFVFLLERVVVTHFCEHDNEECDHFQMIGYSFYVGLTLHSVIDGLVLGSGALIPELGGVVFVAVLAHKLPAVFSLTSILVAGGFRRKRVLLLLAILSLSTPAGAFAAFFGLGRLGEEAGHIAVAVSAGTFIYVALVDLIPSVQWQSRTWLRSALALLAGLALMYLTGSLVHGH